MNGAATTADSSTRMSLLLSTTVRIAFGIPGTLPRSGKGTKRMLVMMGEGTKGVVLMSWMMRMSVVSTKASETMPAFTTHAFQLLAQPWALVRAL